MKVCTQLLIFLCFTVSYAQYTWSPATIYLNADRVLQGEAVIKQGGGFRTLPKESLRFRAHKKDKAQKIEASDIDSIVFTVSYTEKVNKRKVKKERQATFITMYVEKDRKRLHFLEVLKTGKVQLYGQSFGGGGGMSFMPMGSTPTSAGHIPNAPMIRFYGGHNRLFLSKGSDLAEVMYTRKAIAKFFSDCPDLVEKIKTEQLEKDDLNTIVNYYNTNCN
ncbi:hypothetical protein [Psychroserpens algicola]|uniref:GLPGLI family protein n=1 Tax=Psychroserpens algicola TaxID=1719034 RepID=A0ABT0HA72_9FLAO|nr:hypothetical protein [Psychroserpens algicola]MCK8480909.1 hypothetical protein [Psychroserpens algicola]